MSPPVEQFESQHFRQPPGRRPSAVTANSFCGSVSSHGPGVTLVGGTSGGGAMVHPASSDAELGTAASTYSVNVVYDQPVSTMEGRGDSTATGTTVAFVPDVSTFIGESSLSGIRSHQCQSCETAFCRLPHSEPSCRFF